MQNQLITKKISSRVLLLIAVLASSTSFGQRYAVEHITEKEGLLDNEISGIFQDPSGYVWVSNRVGFNRINGNEIKSYKGSGDDFYWLANLNFFTNQNETEWSKGKINTKTGKITIWEKQITDVQQGVDINLKPMMFYQGPTDFLDKEGYKWAFQENEKVVRYKDNDTIDLTKSAAISGFKIVNYTIHKKLNVYASNVNFINDNLGNVWVRSKDKLYQYDFQKKTFIKSGIAAQNVSSVFVDSKNRIWYMCAGSESVLYRYDNGKLNTFLASQFNCGRFPQYLSLVEKKNGAIYIATLNGIVEFKDDKFKLHKNNEGIGKLLLDHDDNIIATYRKWDFILDYENKDELPDKSRIWYFSNGKFTNILSVEGYFIYTFIDNQNIVWVGTPSGLHKCVKSDYRKVNFSSIAGYNSFKHINLHLLAPISDNVYLIDNRDFGIWLLKDEKMTPLISDRIKTVKYFKDSQMNIWLIYNGKEGLVKITPTLKVTNELKGDFFKEKASLRYSSHEFDLFEINNTLLIQYPKGLFKNGQNGFEKVNLGTNQPFEIVGRTKNTLFYAETNGQEDDEKKISGIYVFDLKNNSRKQIAGSSSRIRYCMEAKEEYIVFQEKQILCISKSNLKVTRKIPYPAELQYLGLFKKLDGSDRLWFAGEKCLGVFDGNDKVNPFRFYTTEDGLSENQVRSMNLTLDSNFLIINRSNGVDILDLKYYEQSKKLKIRKVDRFKGFDPTGAVFPVFADRIIFGSASGITDFNLNFTDKNNRPLLYLRKVRLFGNQIDWKQRGFSFQTDFFDVPNELELKHSDNHITFDFVYVSNYNEKIQFLYRLEGFDNKWQNTTFTSVTYQNLPPGDYKLHVKLKGNQLNYENNSIAYPFTILPAFWQTIWFKLLILGLLILGIYIFLKLKTKHLLKKQKDLEQIITERTQEIILEKKEVEKQKEVIEEKNRETLDSIQHTKRLQDVLLSPVKLVKEYHEDSFIIYRSKDIIASDFYWMESIGELTLFAVADCFKKGIPGTMLSLIYINALNKVVKEQGKTSPLEIIDSVNEMISESDEESAEINISLCVLNEKTGLLKWSGSQIPLWIFRSVSNDIQVFNMDSTIEIGQEYSLTLLSTDVLYLFNSGFINQFQNASEKKYTIEKLHDELLELNKHSLEEQKEKLSILLDDIITKKELSEDICMITVRFPEKFNFSFTKRELEIIQYVIKGTSSKQIGEILFISSHTVDTHRRRILKKANVSNTAELIEFVRVNNL